MEMKVPCEKKKKDHNEALKQEICVFRMGREGKLLKMNGNI